MITLRTAEQQLSSSSLLLARLAGGSLVRAEDTALRASAIARTNPGAEAALEVDPKPERRFLPARSDTRRYLSSEPSSNHSPPQKFARFALLTQQGIHDALKHELRETP